MRKVLVVGGKNNRSITQKSKELNIQIIHKADYKKERRTHTYFEKHIKEVDCVILFIHACSHDNMWRVRELTKKYNKPIVYPRGTGTTNAFTMAMKSMKSQAG